MKQPPQPKLVGFFHGIDPASQTDYYTNVVHALFEKPKLKGGRSRQEAKWLPYLIDIKRLPHGDPMDMVDFQIKQFNKFPPFKIVIDTTREEFLSTAFQRKYGHYVDEDSKVIAEKFGNVGQKNTKFKLKQVGYAYIHSGYQWPDANQIEKKGFSRFAKLLRLLKKEMMREIVTFTDTDRVTFKHPVGKHNDLVHGWEMSLYGVMTFQRKNLGYEKRMVENDAYHTILNQIYKDYPTSQQAEDLGPVYDRQIGNSAFNLPS